MGRGTDNVLDVDTFDEIYLKGIQATNRVANTPAQRHYYNLGFDQAIELLDQYFLQEKIEYAEARDRILIIQGVMKDGVGKPKKDFVNPPPKPQPQRDSSGRFLKR